MFCSSLVRTSQTIKLPSSSPATAMLPLMARLVILQCAAALAYPHKPHATWNRRTDVCRKSTSSHRCRSGQRQTFRRWEVLDKAILNAVRAAAAAATHAAMSPYEHAFTCASYKDPEGRDTHPAEWPLEFPLSPREWGGVAPLSSTRPQHPDPVEYAASGCGRP